MSWIDFIQGMYFFGGVKMSDTEYMKLAIKLAKKGAGYVNPNPMVGAVIVKDNRIIGQGYHEIFGGLHAERNALKNCRESPVGATLYVTLEPCCHYGKTPPCTEAIIKSGITRVVVGTLDCNPIVSGKGVKVLEENNIQVVIGILEMECQQLIKVFRKYVTRHIPYVFMKYAMTMDGKIATYTNQSKWISGEKARKQVHQFRHKVTAIMVGVNTVIQDDPLLTCRLENGENPIRIVCDTDLRTPITSKIIKTANDIKTYIATSSIDESKIALYRKCGCEIIYTKKKGNHIDLMNLMQCLGNMQIDSLLLEGGSAMNWSALEQQIVDEVQIYIAPKIFGGSAKSPVSGQGVAFPNDAIMLKPYAFSQVGNDYFIESEVIYPCNCKLSIKASKILEDIHLGDSIAVNGICLTVTCFTRQSFTVDVMNETWNRTALSLLRHGSLVNLERAMPMNGRLGGHIVTGHIDGTGRISSVRRDKNAVWYQINTQREILNLIVEKGSIAIDGISLTVAKVSKADFSVSVIPHTLEQTILKNKQVGDMVNLENDILGKYVQKLIDNSNETELSKELLCRYGF